MTALSTPPFAPGDLGSYRIITIVIAPNPLAPDTCAPEKMGVTCCMMRAGRGEPQVISWFRRPIIGNHVGMCLDTRLALIASPCDSLIRIPTSHILKYTSNPVFHATRMHASTCESFTFTFSYRPSSHGWPPEIGA